MNNLKKITKTLTILTLVALCGSIFADADALAGKGRGFGQGTNLLLNSRTSQEITEEEAMGLLHMYQEEKLARDVYLNLGRLYQQPVFINIASSEQRHMDAVGNLLDFYGLEKGVDDVEGSFTDEGLAKLYEALISKGNTSFVDGLQVGATIEDLDIFDLMELIAATDNSAIEGVYRNLAKGSRNHMRAFISQLEANGSSYTAQDYLSQEEIDAIVSSPRERGPAGTGSGNGRMNRQNRN